MSSCVCFRCGRLTDCDAAKIGGRRYCDWCIDRVLDENAVKNLKENKERNEKKN